MKIQEAKELVIEAGKRLVETGLIARTWGNVSCRVSADSFVITPSGREYLTLTPDEIVEVRISDCAYEGNIKPSSEKGIHAAVYDMRTDINFVIHTHQQKASVAGALGLGSLHLPEGEIICASYGMPSTKKLRKGVIDAIGHSKMNSLIMRNHGALCFGKNYEETFTAAASLEIFCERFIQTAYLKRSGRTGYNAAEYRRFALNLHGLPTVAFEAAESVRTEDSFNFNFNGSIEHIMFCQDDGSLSHYQQIHREIYMRNPRIKAILQTTSPNIADISCKKDFKLLPLLDDFAQIVGRTIKMVPANPAKIASSIKKNAAVILVNGTAYCCGETLKDAQAISMVLDKNCEATIAASLFGKIKPISALDCALMRFVYLKKYSALSNTKKKK